MDLSVLGKINDVETSKYIGKRRTLRERERERECENNQSKRGDITAIWPWMGTITAAAGVVAAVCWVHSSMTHLPNQNGIC